MSKEVEPKARQLRGRNKYYIQKGELRSESIFDSRAENLWQTWIRFICGATSSETKLQICLFQNIIGNINKY